MAAETHMGCKGGKSSTWTARLWARKVLEIRGCYPPLAA
jgi:hypothetical protein